MKKLSPKNQTENNSKFKIFVWSLFDFANTAYSIVVVTFIFAVYFKDVIANGEPIGDLYWSLGISISMIITAVLSPVLGAIADYSAGKKRFLLFFTSLCILATALLYFTSEGTIVFALILFIIANIGFEAGLVFYDSYLPEITSPKNYGRVSGYGFAFGYFGSLITLAIAFPLIQANYIKETFPLAAAFFLIFALPLFIFLGDSRKEKISKRRFLYVGVSRVKNTISNLSNYKNLALFLLSFLFYIEGVNTVIFFSGNYARTTLNFTMQELIVFFIIVQTTAIAGSVLFGIISDSIGQKKTIIISLLIWILTILIAYFSSNSEYWLNGYFSELLSESRQGTQRFLFYVVGLFAGSVMGATQSTSRSLMSKLTPIEKKTEFFGFYSFFGKSSAILGPLVFGIVSYLSEDQGIAILSIGAFFIIGLFLLFKVEDPGVTSS